MMGFRTSSLALLAALALAGCSSTVKLDDAPVESRSVGAGAAGGAGGNPATASGIAGSGAAGGAGGAQSPVAMVDLAPAGGAANGAAGGKLARVVYFDFDSYVVVPEARSLIEAHAKLLAANSGKRLLVEGHTDERGGREYNLALGQKRAEAVAKSLTLLGATEAQVEAVSFGKERPVNEGHDEAAWAQNRRAELKDR